MATRKMAFSLPEPLAAKSLTKELAERPEERDAALIRACDLANQDIDLAVIEKEFDGICDEMAEPWK